jgi:hypothetical protein
MAGVLLRTLAALALLAMAPRPARASVAPDPAPATDPALDSPLHPARLGFRRLAGEREPELLLAQRSIDREWGPSDDSVYVEIEVPGWKSEPLAATLSAILPGAGQRYVGEGNAWMYAAVEVVGWSGFLWYRHDSGEMNTEAEGIAGAPTDPASGWTFERWVEATEGNPADLAGLYAVDREAFLNAIGSDPRYAAGWVNGNTHTQFSDLRGRADSHLRRSKVFATLLWMNHLVSAATALRAARIHNMPLARNLGLRMDGRLRAGRPVMAVALVRKF